MDDKGFSDNTNEDQVQINYESFDGAIECELVSNAERREIKKRVRSVANKGNQSMALGLQITSESVQLFRCCNADEQIKHQRDSKQSSEFRGQYALI